MKKPTRMSMRLTRRDVLKGTTALTALAVAAPYLNTKTAYAQSGAFNWQRFKGETLEVSLTKRRAATCCRNSRRNSRI